jgi:glycosyltransferase involved in cell wall biosynthesis
MVGNFTYEPNLRGAAWVARKVMPLLRETAPNAEVCLVGRHDERLMEVATAPGMKIAGEIAEIGPELRASRCVIVPLLSGSGTRVKVIEALAYGLPIVSTSIGCEGIAIKTGVHALIADDPASFARSLGRILTDDELCGQLGANGRLFYLERYQSSIVADKIRTLVQETIDADASSA